MQNRTAKTSCSRPKKWISPFTERGIFSLSRKRPRKLRFHLQGEKLDYSLRSKSEMKKKFPNVRSFLQHSFKPNHSNKTRIIIRLEGLK